MFELLKKLKNSNYYYYADFDEEEMADSEEEPSTQKGKAKDKKLAKKKNDTKEIKVKEPAPKVTPITPAVSKQMTKGTAVPKVSQDSEQTTEEELNNRIQALKTQVELLKKSKTKEGELLKAQFVELRREKEAMELQRQIDQKQIQYYQNMESANELLQKQLAVESGKVAQLHGKLQGNDDKSKRIAALEAELERTKSQLLKHIKNGSPDSKKAEEQVDYSLMVARLEEELQAANDKMAHYVEYNEQLEVQLSSQTDTSNRQKETVQTQIDELKVKAEAVKKHEEKLLKQSQALKLQEEALAAQAEELKGQSESAKRQEEMATQAASGVAKAEAEVAEHSVAPLPEVPSEVKATPDGAEASQIAEAKEAKQEESVEAKVTVESAKEEVSTAADGAIATDSPLKSEFSDNLKALYRDLAETKKEAHLLFDEVMTVVNKKPNNHNKKTNKGENITLIGLFFIMLM